MTQILQKTKNLVKIIFAVLFFGCVFYAYEFLDHHSLEYKNKKEIATKAHKQNSVSLKAVKEYAKGTEVYDLYLKDNSIKKIAVSNFNRAKKDEKFLGFTSFKIFAREFCLIFGFFIYAIINLFRSFYFERKNTGVKVLHGLIISVCIFNFFWMFQQFQDFSKATYILMTFASSAIVVLAVHLITNYRDHRINRLKKGQFELAKFTFKNTKPEKREEMLTTIERIVKDN